MSIADLREEVRHTEIGVARVNRLDERQAVFLHRQEKRHLLGWSPLVIKQLSSSVVSVNTKAASFITPL